MASIFTSQTPTAVDVSEPGGIALGVTFVPSVNGTVTGIRFYASTTAGGTYSGGLYSITADDDPEGSGTGSLLGSGTLGAPPSAGAWSVIPLSAPVAVVAGTAYRAVYHNTQGHYVSTPAFAPFVSGGLVNGDLTAVAAGTNVGVGSVLQGVYRTGATMQYPSNYFNNSNYFADVVFEAAAIADGSADFPLVISIAAVGATPSLGQGSAGFELVLGVAAEGEGVAPVPGGPCGWEIDPEALGVCADWATRPQAARDSALAIASTFLWAKTGRRYGICPVAVRPVQPKRGAPAQYQVFPVIPGSGSAEQGGPYLFAGQWFNAGSGGGTCCGSNGCSIVLAGPVAYMVSVTVGDDVIDPAAYRVDVARGEYLLVRTDGLCWPTCNSDQDPFVVSYGVGKQLPIALQVATALLACEYVKSLAGGECKLPARMTRLSRQGVDIEVEAVGSGPDDSTGIREVDDIIAALNPGRRQAPPLLLSPDLPGVHDRISVWP